MQAATICPSEHELTRFVQQLLPDGHSDRIRDHLDVCDPCRLGIAVGSSARHTEPAIGLDGDHARGLHLGPFELVRRLGAGGMGVVYEAIDHRLGRAVALKLVRGDHDGSLLEEARSMARIRHPAVLTVYEAGELEGSLYLATELIPGTTLRAHCAGRDRTEILALYRRAAEGLAAAHDHGLVHRDFKPDNVLVEVRGKETRVLVADFGLAITRSERGTGSAGTPGYMAPEQIDGGPIDERVDVYAFCVALWEAVSGVRPFLGGNLTELRAAMRVIPKLPRGVPAIALRGLAMDPATRPSLDELILSLRPRRHRLAMITGACVIAAAATAILLWPQSQDLAAQCGAAPAPARIQIPLAPSWVQQRVTELFDARASEVSALQHRVCAVDDDAARRAWISCRHDHAIEETELARALAVRWPSYDELDDALALPWPATCASPAARLDAVLPPADDDRRTLARARFMATAGTPWHVAPLTSLEAERLLDQAAYAHEPTTAERIALLERAVELAEREGHVTTAARAWLALALARGDANADAAVTDLAFTQASWAIDRAGNPPMLRARWEQESAGRAWQHSDPRAAERHAQAAAALAGDDPHRRGLAMRALATAAGARADFATERAYLETLLPALAHERDADAARFRMMYAECLYHLDDLVPAHREAQAALELARKSAGERDPLTAQALLALGFIQLDEGQPELCAKTIDQALAIEMSELVRGAALNLRASARAALHEWRAALADSDAATALFEARLGPRAEQTMFARMQAGAQARMLGDRDRARMLLTGVLADARIAYGPEDPRTGDVERELAGIYVEDHREPDARALLEHALAAQTHAHMAAGYLAQTQAALAKLTGDRALARTALAAWHDDPAWLGEATDLAAWLRRGQRAAPQSMLSLRGSTRTPIPTK